jgi:hypothetical protein
MQLDKEKRQAMLTTRHVDNLWKSREIGQNQQYISIVHFRGFMRRMRILHIRKG